MLRVSKRGPGCQSVTERESCAPGVVVPPPSSVCSAGHSSTQIKHAGRYSFAGFHAALLPGLFSAGMLTHLDDRPVLLARERPKPVRDLAGKLVDRFDVEDGRLDRVARCGLGCGRRCCLARLGRGRARAARGRCLRRRGRHGRWRAWSLLERRGCRRGGERDRRWEVLVRPRREVVGRVGAYCWCTAVQQARDAR